MSIEFPKTRMSGIELIAKIVIPFRFCFANIRHPNQVIIMLCITEGKKRRQLGSRTIFQ